MRTIARTIGALLGLLLQVEALQAASPAEAEEVVLCTCAKHIGVETLREGHVRTVCRMEFTENNSYHEVIYYSEQRSRVLKTRKGLVTLVTTERYLAFSIVETSAFERFDLGPIPEQYVSTMQEFETGGGLREAPTPLGTLTTGMRGHAFQGGYEQVFERFCEEDALYGVSNNDMALKEKWQTVLDRAIEAALRERPHQEAALR